MHSMYFFSNRKQNQSRVNSKPNLSQVRLAIYSFNVVNSWFFFLHTLQKYLQLLINTGHGGYPILLLFQIQQFILLAYLISLGYQYIEITLSLKYLKSFLLNYKETYFLGEVFETKDYMGRSIFMDFLSVENCR